MPVPLSRSPKIESVTAYALRRLARRESPRPCVPVHACVLCGVDMRQSLAPLLLDDANPEEAEAARSSIVAPSTVSPSAQEKARNKCTEDDFPVHSLHTLLDDLATVCLNKIVPRIPGAIPFDIVTPPTKHQDKAFKLLGLRVGRTQ